MFLFLLKKAEPGVRRGEPQSPDQGLGDKDLFALMLGRLRVVDGDLHLNAGLNADRGDLLDDVGGRVQVDEALVDPARGRR